MQNIRVFKVIVCCRVVRCFVVVYEIIFYGKGSFEILPDETVEFNDDVPLLILKGA